MVTAQANGLCPGTHPSDIVGSGGSHGGFGGGYSSDESGETYGQAHVANTRGSPGAAVVTMEGRADAGRGGGILVVYAQNVRRTGAG